MRDITLVLAYFDNPQMLALQCKRLRKLPIELRQFVRLIVVDDCSPRWPAVVVDPCVPFKLFRMDVDVPWNQDACRNIAMHHCETQWALLTDMDHVPTEAVWRRVITGKLNKHRAYRFARVSAPGMLPYKPHPNSWLMTRGLYESVGGYDEALAGNYGTDGDFLRRVDRQAEIIELAEPLTRYPREVIADASTTTLVRKSEQEKENIKRITKARGPEWKPLNLSFPYARVS